MKPNFLSFFILFLIAIESVISIVSPSSSPSFNNENYQGELPKGYYNFAQAPSNSRPPKVRKPPYLSISTECQGIYDTNTLAAKNNLCGDLNHGFVPRNPMGQYLHGQPYPFEIIKNKTLQFLSKTLPYLKEEIDNVPKVARFVKPSDFFKNNLKRFKRQSKQKLNETLLPVENINENRKPGNLSSVLKSVGFQKTTNATKQTRQHTCEGNIICQAIESLREDGPFSKTFLSNVVSAVGNVANVNNVVSLLDHYNQLNQSGASSGNGNRLALSQILSSISSLSEGSSSNGLANGSPMSNGPSTSSYSPLLSIIDYIQSLQAPKFASKRKTPSDAEELFSERTEKPQTPCSRFSLNFPNYIFIFSMNSTEEYISPTYARNYQGVWKYVVQIPNEGYFTQTIQQTTCLKNKCDLMEGTCRESPRWVSLLVAEIFYPDVYFPANQIMPALYKQQQSSQKNRITQPQPQQLKLNNNIKRPVGSSVTVGNPSDLSVLANMLKRSDRFFDQKNSYGHPALNNQELMSRKVRATIDGEPVNSETTETRTLNDDNTTDSEKKHCDGYDKIGCYIVRVYYDSFLVNGSCKCWKSSHSTINETIKRIFIGKWKK